MVFIFLLKKCSLTVLMCFQVNLIVIGTVPSLIRGVLEQAVCEGDVDFINFLVTEQGVDINGEPL